MKKKIIGCAAALAAMAAAMPASAAGWYAGLSASGTHSEVNTDRIGGDLRALGFSSVNLTTDTKDYGGRAYVGYRLRPWLAVEGYYADLGNTYWQGTVTPTGAIGARIESKAVGIALAPSFSPAKDMLVFAKLGVARAESKASFTSSGFVELENSSRKDTNTAAVYGVGAAWRFGESAFLRVDLDSHDSLGSNEIGGKFKVRAASVGFGLAF